MKTERASTSIAKWTWKVPTEIHGTSTRKGDAPKVVRPASWSGNCIQTQTDRTIAIADAAVATRRCTLTSPLSQSSGIAASGTKVISGRIEDSIVQLRVR